MGLSRGVLSSQGGSMAAPEMLDGTRYKLIESSASAARRDVFPGRTRELEAEIRGQGACTPRHTGDPEYMARMRAKRARSDVSAIRTS